PPEPAQPLLHLRGVALDPAIDRRMVDRNAAFRQHFLKVAIADRIATIPAHRPQDHITLEMAPLEIRHRSVRPISAKHAQASRFLQQSPRKNSPPDRLGQSSLSRVPSCSLLKNVPTSLLKRRRACGPDAMRLGEREEYMSGIIDDSVAALFRLQRCRRWRGVARLEPFDAEGNDIGRV